jgi:hypothetical protein
MFTLFVCAAVSLTSGDDLFRSEYGLPGSLGVTQAAEQYFRGGATYHEIAATIGTAGERVPANDASRQIYRWQGSKLEMHFRNDGLFMYGMNGRWHVLQSSESSQTTQQIAVANNSDEASLRKSFNQFYSEMRKIVADTGQVAADYRERTDLRTLKYYLLLLRLAIEKGNWSEAKNIHDKMKSLPQVQRSVAVAADAKRRIEAQRHQEKLRQRELVRADDERRHQEEMSQREQIHREQMQWRRQIINAIPYRRYN